VAVGAGTATLVGGVAAALLMGLGGGEKGHAAEARHGPTTRVERRDLVVRDDVDGTLGYADTRTTGAAAAGTVTGVPDVGAVVRPGNALYRLDGKPVLLLDGAHAAWRRLAEGVTPGADVRQLEENLVALGYDPARTITVDERFTVATRAAVERFQRGHGLEPTGAIELGQVVFLDGPRRVSQVTASNGGAVAAGAEVLQTTGTKQIVTVELDTDKQSYVHAHDTVEVELPDGTLVRGTITDVGKVATAEPNQDGSAGTPTIEVTIALARHRGAGLDQAPVTVKIATDVRRNVLAVPVVALTALAGGRYALEVAQADGTTALVPVQVGTFADGYVEVSGRGIHPGLRVVEAPQ
jgi:peptidoglycan hydrolase-like protein with peptidoglycan-binding domain